MQFQTTANDDNKRYETKKKNLENEIRSLWLGRQDSNLRITGPKPVALPLGYAPLMCSN
jgi:hypothetical protein